MLKLQGVGKVLKEKWFEKLRGFPKKHR